MDKTVLTWNTYISDTNGRVIKNCDIFKHKYFVDGLKKIARSCKDTQRDEFCERMRKELLYYFWGRVQWEVIIDHWPHWDRFESKKVDVYEQVMMNWEPFCEYVWNHRAVLRRRDKKGEKE
jgi:hypothetical protein